MLNSSDNSIDLDAPSYDDSYAEERRKNILTSRHPISERMELYQCVTKGDLDALKALLETKKYSILEEVSKSGFYWTMFHYASHYGRVDVLKYLIDKISNHPDKFDIFNLQTVEGKTPLTCAILSGSLTLDQKKEIIKIWFETFSVDIRLRKKTGEDILELSQRNNLFEYVSEYCYRED
eukprot:403348682